MKCVSCNNDLGALTSGFCGQCGTKIEPSLDNAAVETTPEPEAAVSEEAVAEQPAPPVAEEPAAETPAEAPAPVVETPVAAASPVVANPVPAPAVNTAENPGFLQKLLKEKPAVVFGGAGGALALILILLFVFVFSGHNPPYEVIGMGRYDEIIPLGGGRYVVERGDRWGIQDTRGNNLVDFGRFDDVVSFTEDFSVIVAQRGRTFYAIDARGREIASFDRYDHVEVVTENRFIVGTGWGSGARVGVVDRNGNYIISSGLYTHIEPLMTGNGFYVWDGNRMGVINNRGNEIISLGRHDDIMGIDGDRFIIRDGQRTAVLNNRGNEVISLGRFDLIIPAGDSHFIVRSDNNWGVVNARGNEVIALRYDSIWYTGSHFIIRDNDRMGVLNMRGNEVISFGRYDVIQYAHDSRFLVGTGSGDDSRIGVIDARGNEVVPMGRYNIIQPVPGNRFIIGTGELNWWGGIDDARWGVIDHRGNEIIPMGRFDSIDFMGYDPVWGSFSDWIDWVQPDDTFYVRTGDRMGVMDMNGRELIPMGRYDAVEFIHNGLAVVITNNRMGLINTRRI